MVTENIKSPQEGGDESATCLGTGTQGLSVTMGFQVAKQMGPPSCQRLHSQTSHHPGSLLQGA